MVEAYRKVLVAQEFHQTSTVITQRVNADNAFRHEKTSVVTKYVNTSLSSTNVTLSPVGDSLATCSEV